jgi:pyruvate carboxylase
MSTKVLVANRGESAVRAFPRRLRAGCGDGSGVPWEYRNSVHRLKADGGYQIGEVGHPVQAPCTLVWRPPHVVPFVRGS